MEGAAGGLVVLEEREELLPEGVAAPQGHRGPHHREIQRGEPGCGLEVGGGTVLIAGAPTVGREAEVQPGSELVIVEVGDFAAGSVGDNTVADPGPDLVEMALASAAGVLAEHVRAELAGIGAGDSTPLVDPHHCGHVADGVQRIGDRVGARPG